MTIRLLSAVLTRQRQLHGHAVLRLAGFASWLGLLLASTVLGADWPTFRHDVSRSGMTDETVAPPLAPAWVFQARHAPQPAWGDPKPGPVEEILELRRRHFDDVFQVAVEGDAVFFASSANHKVYCLDANTGAVRWTKITGGPVRLAPTLVAGRVYVASDDGWAYCLDARQGDEIWKFHAAPEDRRVLGHGKLISLWPSRTGVLVDNGLAYFGAGIFPAERVFLYAVKADDGTLVWKNDTTGERPQSRVSPQGYMLASPSTLYAPMGRVPPAAFDRQDGRMLFETSFGKNVGGTYALLAGGHVYTGTEQMVAFDQQTKDLFASFPARKMIVTEQRFYLATDAHLIAMDRQNKTTLWKTPSTCADELILAGNILFAGGADRVMAVEADTGKTAWFETVHGAAKGLAVAGGRLLVSTDKGRIYSFASTAAATPAAAAVIDEPAAENPFAAAPHGDLFARAADSILKRTGIQRGFCLVYGCETGQLAWELAKRTELTIYAVSPDAQKVTAARVALDAAGLHGSRVCVEQWPLEQLPYSDYFANLVVSETALLSGQWPGDTAQLVRLVKPLGGTILVGQPDGMPAGVAPLTVETAQGWLAQPALAGGQLIQENGIWTKFVRGPLAGAGNWTHLYGNLGNTACSDDEIVKPPLGLLWFGNPGPGDMANRHVRAASPLAFDGRLFVQGENVVMAYDIYNGLRLWRRELPGAYRPNASHDGSNLAVCGKGLLVGLDDHCLLLNVETGETIREYRAPAPTPGNFRRWGYVAADGQTLYGTRAAGAGQSDALFAVDLDSGEQRWSLDGKKLFHNTIAMGDDLVFVVSSDVTEEQRQQALAERRAAIAQLPELDRQRAEAVLANAKVRLVMCLNKSNGQVVWQNPMDLTELGDTPAAMYQNGVLVLFGVYLDGHYWQQFFAGEFSGRRVTALGGGDGKLLWSQQVGYRVRPLIVGDTLHAEPWAFDLRTGQAQQRVHPVTGQQERWQFARPGHHCGAPSASPHTMFFRSWNLGYYDLDEDYGTVHFGGQRPGCWINFLPVGGLAVMAEASTGCMCDFPNQGTVVFQPVKENKAWAWFSAPGLATPVNELALNLGAQGDRRDPSGKLWLAYPRPTGSLVLQLEGEAAFYAGGRFVQGESVYAETENTDSPWLFASAAQGLRKLSLKLVQPGDGTATYRVRLVFTEPVHASPGQRVFDIRLQGNVVAADYDIAASAGGANRAVTVEFPGIAVTDNLVVELVSKNPQAPLTAQPVLQAVEIARERFTSPGCTPPAFVVNNFERQKTAAIKVVNMCETPFAGSIRFGQVPGFAVSIPPEPIQLAAGARLEIPVTIAADEMAAGDFQLPFSMLRADGSVELERTIRIEHLANRTRMVVPVSEDAHVNQRYPTRNWAAQNVMLVDGGNQAMNDIDHAVALLKFQLAVPGTPLTAKLRITNAGNPTGDAGRICLVESPWEEKGVTYETRPPLGRELGRLGTMVENQTIERALNIVPPASGTLSLAIDPTSTDGVDFLSRESGRPAELVIEYNAVKTE